MSYCVNCGVELDDSAKKCPLCSTPVINPNLTAKKDEAVKPFPDNVQIPKGTNKHFIALVVTVIMLIPSIVTFFVNVFFIRNGFWSVYVFASAVFLWTFFVLPLLMKRKNPYLMWLFDTLIAFAYSFIIIKFNTDKIWILQGIMCLLGCVSLAILIFIIWLRHRKRHWTAITVMILSEITIVEILTGMMFSVFSGNINHMVIGSVCGLCSLVLALFFVYCNKSKRVRAWLSKVFYI